MSHPDLLVITELSSTGDIAPASLEALHIGRQIADAHGGRLCAALFGSHIETQAQELSHYGLDVLYTVDDERLASYHPEWYLHALSGLFEELQPSGIILSNTYLGQDLAPRLACRLNAGLIMDCVAVDAAKLLFTKPVFSGNVMAVYEVTSTPFIIAMRVLAVDKALRREAAGEIMRPNIDMNAAPVSMEVIERQCQPQEGISLGGAERIVAGGRGMGGPEGFAHLQKLASILNAALGASRPPCDLEWVAPRHQIGQTGEIVAPQLYIAVGISGSMQHLAGMAGSKTIVAINKDKDAQIFKYADYGVVGPYEEVIPSFTAGVEELRKETQ